MLLEGTVTLPALPGPYQQLVLRPIAASLGVGVDDVRATRAPQPVRNEGYRVKVRMPLHTSADHAQQQLEAACATVSDALSSAGMHSGQLTVTACHKSVPARGQRAIARSSLIGACDTSLRREIALIDNPVPPSPMTLEQSHRERSSSPTRASTAGRDSRSTLRVARSADYRSPSPLRRSTADDAKRIVVGLLESVGSVALTIEDHIGQIRAQRETIRSEINATNSLEDEATRLRTLASNERKRREALEKLIAESEEKITELQATLASDEYDSSAVRLGQAVERVRGEQLLLSRGCVDLAKALNAADADDTERGIALRRELDRIRTLCDASEARYIELGGCDVSSFAQLEELCDIVTNSASDDKAVVAKFQ